MNRAERRRKLYSMPAYQRGGAADVIRQMAKNGITVEDYDKARDKEYKRGFSEGYRAGGEESMKMCYAALALAAHELLGFGRKRACDLLVKMDNIVMTRLNSEDAITEAFDAMGLHIDFADPMCRVQENVELI